MKLECNICKTQLENNHQFGQHLRRHHHYSPQKYYDQFFKKETDGICGVCGSPTNWSIQHRKYFDYCSNTCQNHCPKVQERKKKTCLQKWGVEYPNQSLIIRKQTEATNLKKFGYINPLQNKDISEKKNQTNLQKYGVKSPLQNKDILQKVQQTNLKKYGNVCSIHGIDIHKKVQQTNLQKYGTLNANSSAIVKEKKRKTCIDKYGVNTSFQIKGIKEKIKQTLFQNYGVENPTQNKTILEKANRSSKQSKSYILPSGKIIYKMGYEPQFLDYMFKNNILKEDEIDYSPKGIKYIGIDQKEHYYFPDFYIPKWNLIVEIKSAYTEQLDKNVILKEQATKSSGYQYIRVVSRDNTHKLNFDSFKEFLQNE